MDIKTTSKVLTLIFCVVIPIVSQGAKFKLDPEAVSALEFEQKNDGKCHILSEGGKLMVMHNRHAGKLIEFRLIRYFADVRQQGRATGTIAAGESPIKLGCTLVDGREQRWEIERANFATPSLNEASN